MIRWWHFTFLLTTLFTYGQGEQVWLHPNRGQWDNRIDYKVDHNRGEMLLEPKGFTYYFYETPGHNEAEQTPGAHGHYKTHVIRTSFLGAQTPKAHEEQYESPFYRNYFL